MKTALQTINPPTSIFRLPILHTSITHQPPVTEVTEPEYDQPASTYQPLPIAEPAVWDASWFNNYE
jgi:hypothetical protein